MYTFSPREWRLNKNKKGKLITVGLVVFVFGIIFNVSVLTLTSLTNRATAEYKFAHVKSDNFVAVK